MLVPWFGNARRWHSCHRGCGRIQLRIFLGNPAAAGAGLTLHSARYAIYESLSNQAAHFLQSLDRIHRRGQEREVHYLTLLCAGTIEESEYSRLLQEADRQADLLGDPPDPRPTRKVLADELDRLLQVAGGDS
jgi:SNF2 family DNA or RNA helicase